MPITICCAFAFGVSATEANNAAQKSNALKPRDRFLKAIPVRRVL